MRRDAFSRPDLQPPPHQSRSQLLCVCRCASCAAFSQNKTNQRQVEENTRHHPHPFDRPPFQLPPLRVVFIRFYHTLIHYICCWISLFLFFVFFFFFAYLYSYFLYSPVWFLSHLWTLFLMLLYSFFVYFFGCPRLPPCKESECWLSICFCCCWIFWNVADVNVGVLGAGAIIRDFMELERVKSRKMERISKNLHPTWRDLLVSRDDRRI